VIAHDQGDDEGNDRVKPEQAVSGEDDPTGRGNPSSSGRVGGGVKQDCPHIQIAVVGVVDVAAQDEDAPDHHGSGDAADNQNW
jgi:hypothetical protein